MKYKKYIPNILTLARLIVTPFILYLGMKGEIKLLFIVALLVALTDFLDGYLARKWQVTSELGAKLDAIGDKFLAISLLIVLVLEYHGFFYILVLESIIALFNIYVYFKEKIVESLLVGKIKTWVIFITILVGLLSFLFPRLYYPLVILCIITLLFQLASLLTYIRNYRDKKSQKKKQSDIFKEYYTLVKEILENEEFLKRKEFPHHYEESVYDHTLRVSFDCFVIAKKHHLDYKSLAIAGLLHDFYKRPWQSIKEKKPLFQKHGFTHAKEAVENAYHFFPEIMNEKIKNIMITHMFPLNPKFPTSKEGWLLTFIDKVDSLDFVAHPSMLAKVFLKKTKKEEKK